jgi:hypothetical protein
MPHVAQPRVQPNSSANRSTRWDQFYACTPEEESRKYEVPPLIPSVVPFRGLPGGSTSCSTGGTPGRPRLPPAACKNPKSQQWAFGDLMYRNLGLDML